jgi:hypothetical protein
MSALSHFAPVALEDQPVRQFYNSEAAAFHSDIGNYVPRRIEKLIEEAAAGFGKEPFLTTALPNGASATLNFTDVEKHSANLARYLRDELKLEKGAVVAIQSPNCISNVLGMLAVLRAGLVLTNINPLYTAYETRRQLRDAKAVVLITSSLFPDATEEALQSTDVGTVITLSLTDFFSPVKKAAIDFVLQHVTKMGRPLTIANVSMYEALKRGAKHATPVATYASDRDADEDAIYQYSGGTTGVSKGVRLTEAGVVTNVEQFASLSPHMIDAPGQTMLLVLPVYHVFGMFSSIIALRNAEIPSECVSRRQHAVCQADGREMVLRKSAAADPDDFRRHGAEPGCAGGVEQPDGIKRDRGLWHDGNHNADQHQPAGYARPDWLRRPAFAGHARVDPARRWQPCCAGRDRRNRYRRAAGHGRLSGATGDDVGGFPCRLDENRRCRLSRR